MSGVWCLPQPVVTARAPAAVANADGRGRSIAVKLKTVIRCDASPEIGGGHVVRCLALARELCQHGYAILFLVRPGTLEAVPALAASGFETVVVDDDPRSWPDAVLAAAPQGADWIVIDSNDAGAAEERLMRAAARRILVIDDLANREHDCDLLLDQNVARMPALYRPLVPETARVLLGPQFALLRPEFVLARAEAMARRAQIFASGSPVRRVLVSLGMSDAGAATVGVVEAIIASGLDVAVDVAVGSCAPTLPALRNLADANPTVSIHLDTDEMSALMANADIAIGAFGSTNWERCCLGVPSIIVATAEIQRPIAAALQQANAAILIEPCDVASRLGPILKELSADGGRAMRMSISAADLVDGKGAKRVHQAMERNSVAPPQGFFVRPAMREDCRTVYAWRNDPESRLALRDTARIQYDDHAAWYDRCLSDSDVVMLIAERNQQPVASVQFDLLDEAAAAYAVNIAVAPDRRGQGLGRRSLAAACEELRRLRGKVAIAADVRTDNQAALRIFQLGGFKPVSSPEASGFVRLVYERSPDGEPGAGSI